MGRPDYSIEKHMERRAFLAEKLKTATDTDERSSIRAMIWNIDNKSIPEKKARDRSRHADIVLVRADLIGGRKIL